MRALAAVLVLVLFSSCSDKTKDLLFLDVVDPMEGGEGITMVQVPPGIFQMGSELYPPSVVSQNTGDTVSVNMERPVHWTTLDAFFMSVTEITQKQYSALMGDNPSRFNVTGYQDFPVEQVSWENAVRFCNKLSALTGLDSCYNLITWECDFTKNGFRLPTEAEWEYACKAGQNFNYCLGDLESDLARVGWYQANSSLTTHQVAHNKEPNSWGLYDMHGNVREWCNDFYGRYNCQNQLNPGGLEDGNSRVVRGGSWYDVARDCRSASRDRWTPRYGSSQIGFRIVRK